MPWNDARDDDPFTEQLVAYDDALRTGGVQGDDTAGEASDDPRLRRAKAFLNELEAVWPRGRRSWGESSDSWTMPSDGIATCLGRFQIVRELGRGGGGIVYLAYDPKLRREVALKVPRPESLFTPELRRRFVREADAAAQLDHRSIVPIHEAGEVGGVYYLVAAYCAGPNLADWLHSHRVLPRQAAQIVADLASGVAYMHMRGILHRDIKPRNVLLEPDRAGDRESGYVPRLTDFGLAKLHVTSDGADGLADAGLTRTGAIIGTPAYMAPEQAEGRLDRIGPATDVYALGVLLYELLTGRTPFQGNSDADTLRRIVSDEPTRPRRQRPDVPRDLETICLKCLSRDSGQRYDSALELARDLRRYLRGETVRARPIGAIAQCAHWSRRHPSAVVAIASILALLLALPGLLWYELQLKQAQQVANTQEMYRLLFQVKERRLRHPPGWTWENVEDLQRIAELNPSSEDLPLVRSEQAAALTGIDLRLARAVAPGFLAHEAAFSPDGKLLALVQGIGETPDPMRVLLIDPLTGDLVRELRFPSYRDEWQIVVRRAECSYALAISPEGGWLVVGMRSGHMHRWNLSQPETEATSWKGHEAAVRRLGFTRESGRLCSLDQDGNLKTWVMDRDWQEEVIPSMAKVESMVTFPADGLVACQQAGGHVSVLDGDFFTCLAQWQSTAKLIAAAPDGLTLVTAEPKDAALRKTDSGSLVAALAAAVTDTTMPSFSRDGSLLAHMARTSQLNLWDLANARVIASTVVPRALSCVAFHPAGALLAVPAKDRTYLYEVRRSGVQQVVGMQCDPVTNVAFGFREEVLWNVAKVALPTGRGARLTETPIPSGPPASRWSRWSIPEGHANSVSEYSTAVHPRRDLLVCAGERNIWCHARAGEQFVLGTVECVNDLCFDPAGTLWVADHFTLCQASDIPGPLRSVWQSDTADQSAGVTLKSVAAGATGVLVGKRDGTILWFADERLANSWRICTSEVRCLAISRDERFALAGTELGKVFLMTLPDGAIVCELSGHSDWITGLTFLGPELFASGSRDGTISMWSVDGAPLLTLDAPGPILRLQATPDGTRLAVVVEGERAVRLWNLDQLNAELGPLGLPLGREQLSQIPQNAFDHSPAPRLPAQVERPAGPHGLKTEIFATFQDKIVQRYDRQVNLVSCPDAPDPILSHGERSARWTGWLKPAEPGAHRLWLYHAGSAHLWLDGKLVLGKWNNDKWGLHQSESVVLENRAHSITLVYKNDWHANHFLCRLLWQKEGQGLPELVPAEALFHERDAAEKAVVPPRAAFSEAPVVEPPSSANGLKCELFAGSLGSSAHFKVKERYDDQVSFGPTMGAPDKALFDDFFSMVWSGWLQVPKTGNYTFVIDHDDWIRFALDDKVLRQELGPGVTKVAVNLKAGPHAIELQFAEFCVTALCKLYWIPPGEHRVTWIPKSALLHEKPVEVILPPAPNGAVNVP